MRLVFALLAAWLCAARALADDAAALKAAGCAGIARAVDAAAVSGPVFVASYPAARDPALVHTAFVYDNALAVMALLACGDRVRAARVGAALRIAAGHDRFFHDGRIRNAYRAGMVAEGVTPALPGWWDAGAKRWNEDANAVGTSTGNVAWAALGLLALGDAADRAAAAGLMRWVAKTLVNDGLGGGYSGGFFGEEPNPARLGWASCEHNVDAAAAFGALRGDDPVFAAGAARAGGFVGAMWDEAAGRFWLGTDASGRAVNRAGASIDAELWPLIGIAHAPVEWGRAKDFVRAHLAVRGGFGFRDGGDAVWTEGTAQAALVLGDRSLFTLLLAQRAEDGLLYATPDVQVRTGLALTPGSTTDDFRYFHEPHLGATAWAVLAATGTNPFRPQ